MRHDFELERLFPPEPRMYIRGFVGDCVSVAFMALRLALDQLASTAERSPFTGDFFEINVTVGHQLVGALPQ